MNNNNKPDRARKDALTALTSAALLLPGVSNTQADAQPETTTLGYRYSFYKEDDLDRDKVAPGSTTERYEIDINQLRIEAPIAETFSIVADLAYERMSGASPWQTEKNAQGEPVLIMSGASIRDNRTDVAVTLNRHRDKGRWGVFYQYSGEDDYISNAAGFDLLWELNSDMTTIGTGLSYSFDQITPTQGVFPTGTLDDDKRKGSVYLSGSQVINAKSVFQTALSYTQQDGYLDDPYKFNDRRPDQRRQWALTAGYRYFLDSLRAALHADYRFYHDSWGIDSQTLSVSWYQNIGRRWQLVPYLRYYSQTSAGFFGNEAREHEDDRYFSDDYRMSGYGAWSFGLKLNLQFDNWLLTASGQRYISDAGFALQSVDEIAPGLVDFNRFTLGLSYRFE